MFYSAYVVTDWYKHLCSLDDKTISSECLSPLWLVGTRHLRCVLVISCSFVFQVYLWEKLLKHCPHVLSSETMFPYGTAKSQEIPCKKMSCVKKSIHDTTGLKRCSQDMREDGKLSWVITVLLLPNHLQKDNLGTGFK